MSTRLLAALFALPLMLHLPATAEQTTGQLHEFKKHENIVWHKDSGLTLDIYVPQTGRDSYPVLVIYHGGGWLINDNTPMDSMSEYIAARSEYLVANMNYHLLGDRDNTVTINQIVEDAMGGLLWVKHHIADYGGDPQRVAVTGDSAGGHLAAMVTLAGRKLGSGGFGDDALKFTPSYMPPGETPEQLAQRDALRVRAAILSYGAFDLHAAAAGGFETPGNIFWQLAGVQPRGLFGDGINVEEHPRWYRAVSPLYLVPERDDYPLPPQFAHVGSIDQVTPPEAVKAYVERVREAGHPIEYKLYPGKNHAFLDADCNEFLGTCFDKDAPDTLDDMIRFLDQHL